ncbi:hypothetical protein PENTCL1PPCAC_23805, partial [Pristionchus entomophagus]
VENLLKIADRFDIPKIMNSIEDVMSEMDDLPIEAQLLLSDQYHLHAVQAYCLEFYSAEEDSLTQLSSVLKGEIMKKMNKNILESVVTEKIRVRVDNVKNLTNYG